MRLVTRSDFDGSVCTAILEELGLIDDILYVHPKDMQDNKIKVTRNDILANVPFVKGCGLWFDHHSSERERLRLDGRFKGASKNAPSAAQVVYDYYKQDKACAENPSIPTEIEKGNFAPLHAWMADKIYRHGRKYWPADLTERICGEPIQVTSFVNYMKTKFSDIYGL